MIVICPKCGKQISDLAKYCDYCGAQFGDVPNVPVANNTTPLASPFFSNQPQPVVQATLPINPNISNTIASNQIIQPVTIQEPKESKKIYFIIGGIFILCVGLMIGAFNLISGASNNFPDSLPIECGAGPGSSEDCSPTKPIETPGVDTTVEPPTGMPTTGDNISNIGSITSSDLTTYRSELISKINSINSSVNSNCNNQESVTMDNKFQNQTKALFTDLCSMEPTYLNNSLDVLDRLYKKFPNAIAGVNLFGIESMDDNVYGGFQPKVINTGNDYIYTIAAGLNFNSKVFSGSNIESAKKYYERDLQLKYHPKNTDYAYIYAHEVTHDMEYLLVLNKVGVDDLLASDDINNQSDMIDIWNTYTVSKAIVKEAVANLSSKSSNLKTEAQFIEEISGYAAAKDKNGQQIYAETLAEAVTDYLANGSNASQLTLEIIPILGREMSKL